MRITEQQHNTIITLAQKQFGPSVKVWLFGSRANDQKQGGDIDLLVESSIAVNNHMLAAAQFNAALQLALGEQKIDVLLLDPQTPPQPIHQIAKQKGIELTAMQQDPEQLRLLNLLEVVQREIHWLQRAEKRLFAYPMDEAWFNGLANDDAAAETLEAFVSRFARLQDNLGDKLIPATLKALAERTGSALDNLNKAEKLGLLWSAQDWLAARNLRNRMVHEYQPLARDFLQALQAAHGLIPNMVETYRNIQQQLSHSGVINP
ncbi:nucleotidyltransferase domain-containing protein [Zobellella taiwanensis]